MHVGPQGGSRLVHKLLATASGAAGGAFGLAALPIELPASTIIMLRSIAEIARNEGEDPSVLTQKFAAQALPVVGALGGASLNYLFIEHFQETAQGHFTVRRLERAYGKDVVQAEYERLAQKH